MDVLYIVLPLALLIAGIAVGGFVWMVNGGQLDDLESPAHRILHDDAPRPGASEPRAQAPAGDAGEETADPAVEAKPRSDEEATP